MGIVDLGKVRGTQTYTGNKITGSNANATVFPETGIAKAYEGDLYINTDVLSEFKGNVYECTVAGEPDAAKWIFKGSIRGPKVDTVNNLKSTSTEDALSAYQGKRLLDMMKEAGVFSRKVVVDYDGTVFGAKLTIDNVNSTFSFLINGREYKYTYEAAGKAETTTLSVSLGTNLGMEANGGILTEIRSSAANIYYYVLTDNTSAGVYSKTVDIWESVNDNKQSHEITGTIVDGDETFYDGPIKKVVNGIKKVFFPITHAKAVWFEKKNGVTVYDKIVELVSGLSNEISSRKNAVEDLSASMASEITGLRNSTSSQISNEASERKLADDTLAARMDTFTSLPSGSTSGDAELQDIRVGAGGEVYGSAGEAVRGQIGELKGDLATVKDNFQSLTKVNLSVEIGVINIHGSVRTDIGKHAEYSDIKAGDKYRVFCTNLDVSSWVGIMYYDGSNYIPADEIKPLENAQKFLNLEVTVPYGAKKMYLNADNNTELAIYKIDNDLYNSGKFINSLQSKSDAYIDYTELGIELKQGYYAHNTRDFPFVSNTNYRCAKIKVSNGDKYIVSCSGNNTLLAYTLITDDNTVIDWEKTADSDTPVNIVNKEFDIEYDGYLILNSDPVGEKIKVLKKDRLHPIDNHWKNKRIVWFGTSIPAGKVDLGGEIGEVSYPTLIGKMLGATVYNQSVASSAVRFGNYQYKSESDQYGLSGQWYDNFLYSLSASSSEKQEIFNNWDKWGSIIQSGSGHVGHITPPTDEEKKWALETSYDRRLDPYLSTGDFGACDLYVFDCGHNEEYNGDYSHIKDIPPSSNPKDRSYFMGAMRFLIERILNDNPKAKICFIGHYQNDIKTGISEAQEKLAEIWKYPLFKTWEKIGWSQNTITYNGQTKTIADIWLPDTLHPHSDTSGEAIKHYANVLFPFIRDLE